MSRVLAALAAVHLLAACSGKPAPSPQPSPPPGGGEGASSAPTPAAAPPVAPVAAPAPAPSPTPPTAAAPAAAPFPAPSPPPAAAPAPAAAPSPAPAAAPAPAATPTPAPAATPARNAVGPDRCKACHRIQHTSWAAGGHPAKGVDCEFCHGPGSDYIPIKIMKDPVAARAAGLVIPAKDRCLPCHAAKWSDDLLAKSHAHKPK